MDRYKKLEEELREAACNGDVESLLELLAKGVNPDARHSINGWTALHWAAKRDRKDIVEILLDHGADKSLLTEKGESAHSLASSGEVRDLLSGGGGEMNGGPSPPSQPLTIMPSYMRSAPNLHAKDYSHSTGANGTVPRRHQAQEVHDELVVKVRVANGGDPDFIEIELPKNELTYYSLLRISCEELNLNPSQVLRIRKLPNTMLRKDKDVQRLTEMQELEVVVNPASVKHQPNGYKSIQLYKNQTILY